MCVLTFKAADWPPVLAHFYFISCDDRGATFATVWHTIGLVLFELCGLIIYSYY